MYKKLAIGLVATSALMLGACSDEDKKEEEVTPVKEEVSKETEDGEIPTEEQSIELEHELGFSDKESHKVFGSVFKYDSKKVNNVQKFKDGRSELYKVDGLETRELVVVYDDNNQLMFTSYLDVIGTEDGDQNETKEQSEKRLLAKFNEYIKAVSGEFDENKLETKEIDEGFFVTYYKGDKHTFIYNKDAYNEEVDVYSFTFYSNEDPILEQLGVEEAKSEGTGAGGSGTSEGTETDDKTEKEDKE